MKSAKELVAEANARVKTVSAQEAAALLKDPDTAFVDVRDSAELQREGKIPGAVHVNRGMLEFAIDPGPDHNPVFSSGKKIVLYCAKGGRSALAADTAQKMGLDGVVYLGGGFKAWKEAAGPTEKA